MLRTLERRRQSRPNALDNRSLRLESLESRWLCAASVNLALGNSGLSACVKNLAADGTFSRKDMLAVLAIIQTEKDGVIDATDLSDLRKIVKNAPALNMPDYVYVLANDVVNGNVANAHYQGRALGNLTVGSSNAKYSKLIGKWFYGTDLPSWGTTYAKAAGTLWGSGPSHLDEMQGQLGDCYLISALGSIADSSPSAIKNMFVDNGDNTWTVRFYYNGVPDYVTVTRSLAVSGGYLVFDGYGSSYWNANNVLWLPLLEKAYVQWNETGKTQRGSYSNSYGAIEGGWMGDVYQQVLGYSTVYGMSMSSSVAKSTLLDALANHQAVTIGTVYSPKASTGLYGNHAYNVLSYNGSTGKFTLYNPWGCCQPSQLTWSQLSVNADGFAATSTTSTPAALAKARLRSTSFAVFADAPPIVTATTLDVPDETPQAAAAPAPRTVDAVIADWDPPADNNLPPVVTTSRPTRSFWSDAATGIAARSSGNVFADVDTLFDSLRLSAETSVSLG